MELYFKCSFKNSRLGYRVSIYNTEEEKQIYIEDNQGEKYKSSVYRMVYNYEMGNMTFLATDERGGLMLAVLGLVEGQYDKYVNVIFGDERVENVYRFFLLLCEDYDRVNKLLLDAVEREEADDIMGYKIDSNIIQKLCKEAENKMCNFGTLQLPKQKLFALMSTDKIEECMFELQKIYENKDFASCEICLPYSVGRQFIECVNDKLRKSKSITAEIVFTILIICLCLLFFIFIM